MLKHIAIKDLYALALAEGEGMGTAYEYFAKRLVLDKWLKAFTRPNRVLIAGLPEKYGASLDSILLAQELGARQVTVIDERPAALDRLKHSLAALDEAGVTLPVPDMLVIESWSELPETVTGYDLAISSEVVQRLAEDVRPVYVQQLRQRADHLAVFTPNADNPAHTDRSGLGGLSLGELTSLAQSPVDIRRAARTGYVDMPPFPPGITRSEDQREQATTGLFEASVMRGLETYARTETLLPESVRKRQSHIVYALVPG